MRKSDIQHLEMVTFPRKGLISLGVGMGSESTRQENQEKEAVRHRGIMGLKQWATYFSTPGHQYKLLQHYKHIKSPIFDLLAPQICAFHKQSHLLIFLLNSSYFKTVGFLMQYLPPPPFPSVPPLIVPLPQ